MKFFDEGGNRIESQEWLDTYEPYYFLGNVGVGCRIRNRTSRFVEGRVCDLLGQTAALSLQDLVLVMAWKTGMIDQLGSDVQKKIVFAGDWATRLTAYGQRTVDFSSSIPSLAAKMPTAQVQVDNGSPRYLYDLAQRFEGFGPVYALTVLFFASHGRFPIYDRYAHIAAQAIHEDLPPEANVSYRQLSKWREYERYMDLLARVRNACPKERADSSMFVSRTLDRALWVYGHFFKTGSDAACR
jgi:hypothetical protein